MLLDKRSGDRVCEVVLLRLQKIGSTSTGGIFARGTVQDNSGVINFITFERSAAETIKNMPNPCAVTVFGVVQPDKYAADGGANQLLLERVEAADKNSDLSTIMPVTEKDIEAYKQLLVEIIDNINKPYLKILLSNIFNEAMLERFAKNPAAMKMHHAYIGGLLEHSVEAALIVKSLSGVITDIRVDWDLAATGAILHDIGKIEEISSELGFDYTNCGRLLGHIMIGAALIKEEIARIADFPPEEAEALLHIIVSHHGEQEKGSPVPCATPESLIVHYADEINATLNQFSILGKGDSGEWQYSKMLSRQLRVSRV